MMVRTRLVRHVAATALLSCSFPNFLIAAETTPTYVDFIPNHETQTCTNDTHVSPFNRQVRGVNLGGWMVLEPWITPTLFYQFLGTQKRFGDKAPTKTAMDMHSFCLALGPEEANRQLQLHWSKWVTERDIKALAEAGLNSLRIPVGDWMFKPYAPYIDCTAGALAHLDRVMDLALKYRLDVLIDIHAHIDSQNGFDNSGKSQSVKWTSLAANSPIGTTTFEHWPIRTAEWIGTFDSVNLNYSSINQDNINHSLQALEAIVLRYKDHPAMLGIEPINEPWELTPLDILKTFYWEGYLITKRLAPKWKYVMHDSFRFGLPFWGNFMTGCPDIALDTHIYQAWNTPGSREDYFANACQQKFTISAMEKIMPVIVGEWSLGTDNCAMWLNGFNDNLPGFPKVQCDYIPCGVKNESYLGETYTGLSLDRTKPIQGPYGTGLSGPTYGKCPVSQSDTFDLPDSEFFPKLGMKKLNAFTVGHGFYFWNFKTELDPKWDYLRSVQAGWLVLNDAVGLDNACLKEDSGEFICTAKPGVAALDLENGLAYACNDPDMPCLDLDTLSLFEKCDFIFNLYWRKHRVDGTTCDFGGAATLKSPPNGTLPELPTHVMTDHYPNPFPVSSIAPGATPVPAKDNVTAVPPPPLHVKKVTLFSFNLQFLWNILALVGIVAIATTLVKGLMTLRQPSRGSYQPLG